MVILAGVAVSLSTGVGVFYTIVLLNTTLSLEMASSIILDSWDAFVRPVSNPLKSAACFCLNPSVITSASV